MRKSRREEALNSFLAVGGFPAAANPDARSPEGKKFRD